jgi:hypothetical protein
MSDHEGEGGVGHGASRRQVIRACAGAGAVVATGGAGLFGSFPPVAQGAGLTSPGDGRGDEALDEALLLLQGAEPESRQGLSTHAPMVAEALCALGRPEEAVRWVARYRAPLLDLPRPAERIDPKEWRRALGPDLGQATWERSLARWADWRDFFAEELRSSPWPEVLDRWAGRLAPGLCGAATHGVIRTAHAARALGRRETEARRGELARGLAYWASSYQELPARPSAGPRVATYHEAFEALPSYWDRHRRVPAGNIVSGLREAGELPGFADALDRIVTPVDVDRALSDLTAAAARAYLRHGTAGRDVATVAFVHAVTGPQALRKLAPFLRPETAAAALPYAWQAAAGIHAAYARRENLERRPEPKTTPAELVARAAENGDEHAIKFTEALLVEHGLRPDPVYLAAAEDGVARL